MMNFCDISEGLIFVTEDETLFKIKEDHHLRSLEKEVDNFNLGVGLSKLLYDNEYKLYFALYESGDIAILKFVLAKGTFLLLSNLKGEISQRKKITGRYKGKIGLEIDLGKKFLFSNHHSTDQLEVFEYTEEGLVSKIKDHNLE